MVHRTRRALPAALALAMLASQVCFFTALRGAFGGSASREIRVRAETDPGAKAKVNVVASSKPASAPTPGAPKTDPGAKAKVNVVASSKPASAPTPGPPKAAVKATKDAKVPPPPPPPPPAAKADSLEGMDALKAKADSLEGMDALKAKADSLEGMDALKASREKMSGELKKIAEGMGILTNVTRSDVKLFSLIKDKVNEKGTGPKELQDLEQRLARADLALMLEEPSAEIANFELVSKAAAKVEELAEAKSQIQELESELAASQARSDLLLQGLKEIGGLVGVGGFGGIMQFFMSDEDLIKETKEKVGAKQR